MNQITQLDPQVVWKNFYALTQIPRPSKHEEKVSEYLYNWGVSHGFETIRDEVGNVIIRKPATKGCENKMGVIFQGHMDMVPQKNADVDHDFLTDPIKTRIEGDWVKTTGTTLGADNGIGVALALSAFETEGIQHGPLEALFTVDEETGMTGAFALSPDVLKGNLLINVDSEMEGELCIGCAGGLNANISATYERKEPQADFKCWTLLVKGLKGGHSGMDINLYRANSNIIAARFLYALMKNADVRLLDMEGGTLRNAIPRETECTVYIPQSKIAKAKKIVAKVTADVKAEFALADPGIEVVFKPYECTAGTKCNHSECLYVEEETALRFVRAILACPNGVERMSDTLAGLTETSNNLAVVKIEKGKLAILTLLRSSLDCAKMAYADRIEAAFALAGCKVKFSGGYSGWAPDSNSIILKVMKEVYKEKFGKEPAITATHGGLECGILGAKYPNWDMVSCGPTLLSPHSPDERLFIPSVPKTWELLKAVLAAVPEK